TLPAIDYSFSAGHRLRLVLTTTDFGYATPPAPAVYQVALAGSGLTVPGDPALTVTGGGAPGWVWAAPLCALAAAILILALGWRLEEGLALAGLGTAIDRPVRSYSRGMCQRLAIAQAMLGLPDLLVLDEPMNGLDPPQIREMRDALLRYAAAGRTVVLSSHLLAEVEQTCSHVVVMHQGRRVAAGPVADII